MYVLLNVLELKNYKDRNISSLYILITIHNDLCKFLYWFRINSFNRAVKSLKEIWSSRESDDRLYSRIRKGIYIYIYVLLNVFELKNCTQTAIFHHYTLITIHNDLCKFLYWFRINSFNRAVK